MAGAQFLAWVAGIFFEKIFCRFVKWLYLCTRFSDGGEPREGGRPEGGERS